MQIVTKNKTINLVFTTRKIVNVTNLLNGKNFEELYFKAMNEINLDALSKIIYTFAEDEIGAKSFNKSEEVYDFIDDYKKEQDKTYLDIFKEVAGAINEEGFFNSKMSKKQLSEKTSNPFSNIDMNKIIETSTEKAISRTIDVEMQQQQQELKA